MKTLQLIDCLTNKEINSFFIVIKNEQKGNRLKLFEYLVKNKNKVKKIDPASIFKAVFKETYNSSKDYLLRNELRLLNQLLETFIAQEQLDTREERYLYLQFIQKKGLIDLFNKEVKKEIKKALAKDDYGNLARLHQLVLQQNLKSTILTKENIKKSIKLCNTVIFYEKRINLYQTGELEMIKAYFVKNIRILGEDFDHEIIDDIPTEHNDAYLSYLKCKAKSHISKLENKQENLIKALDLIDTILYFKLDKESAKVSTLNNLALEYLLAYDYKNAIISFEQLIANKQLAAEAQFYVLFNYLTSLLKAGYYSKAIKIIEAHFSEENKIPALAVKVNSIKAIAWIHTGDLKKAYNGLLLNFKKGSQVDYVYYRLVLSIIFYLEKNVDLALREVENILQSNREQPLSPELDFCAKAFKKHFTSEHKPKKRAALLASIHAFVKAENAGSDLLPLLWLRGQLEGE